MLVYFGSSVAETSPGANPGGTPVAVDYDTLNGSNSAVLWTFNSVTVTATSSSEVLSFVGLDYPGYTNNGGASYGNEIDDVSLIATPEPSTWLLLLSGLGLLGLVLARRRQVLPPLFWRKQEKLQRNCRSHRPDVILSRQTPHTASHFQLKKRCENL